MRPFLRLGKHYWTFPVPGSDSVVATLPDSEGFLVLNPTAAWIWQHREDIDLSAAYTEHFGVSASQAEADISQTLATWVKFEPFRSITIGVLETLFHLQFGSRVIAEELLPRLVHLEIAEPADIQYGLRRQHSFRLQEYAEGTHVYLDGSLMASEQFVTGARAVVLQELTRLAVPGRTFSAILHAGACGHAGGSGEGDGSGAIILAGASFSGKSTLCTSLMQSGLLCLSDDSVCLTPDFRVVGMPFALSLREGSWPLFPDLSGRRFLPSNLHGSSPAMPAQALVFVNYQADASGAVLERVATFEALLEIQQSGFWVAHTQPAITAFLGWLARIPRYRLTYSSLEAAREAALQILHS